MSAMAIRYHQIIQELRTCPQNSHWRMIEILEKAIHEEVTETKKLAAK